jgi:uncharacterized protein
MNSLRLASAVVLIAIVIASIAPRAVSPDIVISQVYGGGGNASATLRNDFIELYNRGSVPVNVMGWTVQYAASTGTSWQATPLSGTIDPGRYYLVQEGAGGGGTVALPTPDATGTINMSASAGKVALVRTTTLLTGTGCPIDASVGDLVGFGGASCAETSPTPGLSNTTAALRRAGGTVDTDDNAADFVVGAPTPRNSAAMPAALNAVATANPPAVNVGESSLLTVAVSPASPPGTNIHVSIDLSSIAEPVAQNLADDGLGGDVMPNDYVFSLVITAGNSPGLFALPVVVTDDQGGLVNTSIAFTIIAPPANVVISQVYGGGGNSGAVYRNDFIELRNREPFDVSVAGWSVQYASASGTSWASTTLSGTIPAGSYYLVQEAAGAGGSLSLPAPDAVGTIAMSASSGKIALVAGSMQLTGSCPLAFAVDFVGYGTANCFEGSAAAPGLGNETAAIRSDGGVTDTNDNGADFLEGAPAPKSTVGVPPTGIGAASPAAFPTRSTTLLTVRTTPGAFPPSPIVSVVADLSTVGGFQQALFDDGTNGDAMAGDFVFSYLTTISGTPGFRTIAASIADARGRIGSATIRLAIETPTSVPISAIQGRGSTSPLVGQFVTTSGVVTALRSNGYFIQTPDGLDDRDDATSEGIFVFSRGATRPSIGDDVHVSGTVAEFAPAPPNPPTTEISGGPLFAIAAIGEPLPEPIALLPSFTSPSGPVEQLEPFEGMRVRADLSVIAPTGGTVFESDARAVSDGDFYAVIDGVVRPVREPGLDPFSAVPPGLPCCVPRFDGNPERLRVDSDGQLGGAKIDVAAGQRIFNLVGVLDFGLGSYTILPDPGAATIVGAQQATPVPPASANEFTVASFNLERFFDESDDPDKADAVLTPAAVSVRLQKASLTVRDVLRSPDILAVVEVENLAILQRLAARINGDAVAAGETDPQYVAYLEEGNDVGGIDSGFLVKSSKVYVMSIEQFGKDTTYMPPDHQPNDPLPLLNDRPPLVLRAGIAGPFPAPYPVTVIVNHLRSLSGIDGPDGARIRIKRRAQAEYLATLIQQRQATERIISVGDYNAFPFNDGFVDSIGTINGQPTAPDQVALASPDLVEPNLTNFGDGLGPQQQYSFVFGGNAQALDHVLVNGLALRRFTRMSYARSNADFPESLRGDPTRPERLSDHDAAVAYFSFPGAPIVTLNDANPLNVEAYTSFADPGATAQDDERPLATSVSGSVDVSTPGDYTLTYTAANGFLTTTVTRLVRVRDTIPPAIESLAAAPHELTPPDHRMIDVAVPYSVSDGSGAMACGLSVASNEAENGRGDGDASPDWRVIDVHNVQLRAERSGWGTGRIYTIAVTCSDAVGNESVATTQVVVPKCCLS